MKKSKREKKIKELDDELTKLADNNHAVVDYLQIKFKVEELEEMTDEEYLENYEDDD